MKAFKTYQEAKIANPDSAIYTDGELFCDLRAAQYYFNMKKCNPTDYCMTVEKFLADGYKFVGGDVAIDVHGDVMEISNLAHWNKDFDGDNRRYVLRAKALEQPKHTKVEYVKIEFAHAWEAVKAFEDGEELYTNVSSDTYSKIETAPDVLKYLYRLYHKVTTELTEREVFIENASKIMHKINGGVVNDLSLGAVFDELVEDR